MAQLNYITPAGLKKIQDELRELLHVERPKIVKTVSWAAANGDRSENADYIYGKRRLREIDRRIHFLQSRLDNLEVVDPSKVRSDRVSFGATVTIVDEDGIESVFQIVGTDEFKIEEGKISWQSPVAKSLLGKTVGDSVVIVRPKGKVEVEILAVKYK